MVDIEKETRSFLRAAFNEQADYGLTPIAAIKRGRDGLGFPGWRKVCDWLDESITASEPGEVSSKQPAIKNCEIPRLADYSSMPDEDFWLKFPKKELPVRAETSLNISAFAEEISASFEALINSEPAIACSRLGAEILIPIAPLIF